MLSIVFPKGYFSVLFFCDTGGVEEHKIEEFNEMKKNPQVIHNRRVYGNQLCKYRDEIIRGYRFLLENSLEVMILYRVL